MDTLEFLVIPDTNLLRTRDEKMAFFSSEFSGAMRARLGTSKRAFVCDITAKEIVYQKTAIAQANLDKLIGASKSLQALSGHGIQVQDLGDLRTHVQAQLNEKMKDSGFELLPTPIHEIDWAETIEDAVWRRAPFEGNPDSKTEKGFRDAIFVQTVLAAVKKKPKANWCVLTNDGLIYQRLEAERTKNGGEALSLFRTTEEFLGHVELRVQKIEVALAANLQAKAHVAFYDPAARTGVFTTTEVENAILKDHGRVLQTVPRPLSPNKVNAKLLQLITPTRQFWIKNSSEQIFLEGTRFAKRETKGRIQWITRVRMCALFLRAASSRPVYIPSVIRDTRFDVAWSADVHGDTFLNASIDGTSLVSNERVTDSLEMRLQLGLPLPPESSVYRATTVPTLSTNVPVPSGVPPPAGLIDSSEEPSQD